MKLTDLNEAAQWAISYAYDHIQDAWNVERSDWSLSEMQAGRHPAFMVAAEQFDQSAYRSQQIAAGKLWRVRECPLLLDWKAAMRQQFEDFL